MLIDVTFTSNLFIKCDAPRTFGRFILFFFIAKYVKSMMSPQLRVALMALIPGTEKKFCVTRQEREYSGLSDHLFSHIHILWLISRMPDSVCEPFLFDFPKLFRVEFSPA